MYLFVVLVRCTSSEVPLQKYLLTRVDQKYLFGIFPFGRPLHGTWTSPSWDIGLPFRRDPSDSLRLLVSLFVTLLGSTLWLVTSRGVTLELPFPKVALTFEIPL